MTTIAEVLHRAADEFLADDGEWPYVDDNGVLKNRYSCAAVCDALDAMKASVGLEKAIFAGLEELGCNTASMTEFQLRNPQSARYAWLKFAALIAEEQGV